MGDAVQNLRSAYEVSNPRTMSYCTTVGHAGHGAPTRQHELRTQHYEITQIRNQLSSVLGEIRAYLGSPQSQKVTFGIVLMIDNSTKVILDGFETNRVTG